MQINIETVFKYSKNINEKPSFVLRTLPDETNQTLFGYKLGTKVSRYFTQNEVKSYTSNFEEAAAKKYYDIYISAIMPGKHKSPHFSNYYLVYDSAGIIYSVDAT